MYLSKEISYYCPVTGALYVDFSRYATRYGINARLKYFPWRKHCLRTYRRNGSRWEFEPYDLEIPLITEDHLNDADLPVHSFIREIPDPILNRVLGYRYLQTTLLQLFSFSSRAVDLFDAAPVLLWLIADITKNDRGRLQHIDSLLVKRMIDILNSLIEGRPFSNSHVNFLRKLKVCHGTQGELGIVKMHLLNPSSIEAFRYWESVPVHLLRILDTYPALTDSNLMKAIQIEEYNEAISAAVLANRANEVREDAFELATVLQIPDAKKILDRCFTKSELIRVHDRWQKRFNRRYPGHRLGGEILSIIPPEHFPDPPIPGNTHIRPILTDTDLMEEGRTMGHCVGGYADRIRRRESFIYSVYHPERSTLEIQGRGLQVRIGQFKLAGNMQPAEESWRSVREWIEDFKKTGQKVR